MIGLYVQYGCFFTAPEEWMNFDAALALKWEKLPFLGRTFKWNGTHFPRNVRVGDIVAGLPVPNRSCRGVYASHVLEHLALDEFHKALDNSRKILADDGVFRMVVPDLEWSAREYVRRIEAAEPTANASFLDETGLGHRTREGSVFKFLHTFLKRSAHLWMWDTLALTHSLQQHGFTRVRKCAYGDCEDPMFALVEAEKRFEHAVALEARP
jgi:hypothetical protein